MRMYVVKTDHGYLYPFRGAVSFTDNESHAGLFLQAEEAHVIAQVFGYTEERYSVIAVEIAEMRQDSVNINT
ncbi:hypothetical protein [Janthinobacterium sp. 17J80-10]|uniref:hypothetical protein n=1 Tax=Janthinobacterium sp. 17J80-10 TaxID=2497863 RepID=UPI00100557FC|nr:hypothetical protein [Janthinobacterium sp. 17J80-10]QAU34510.1 hypothetical protein EKL02_10160 [Janthinobacterium sp. 17J80-10]